MNSVLLLECFVRCKDRGGINKRHEDIQSCSWSWRIYLQQSANLTYANNCWKVDWASLVFRRHVKWSLVMSKMPCFKKTRQISFSTSRICFKEAFKYELYRKGDCSEQTFWTLNCWCIIPSKVLQKWQILILSLCLYHCLSVQLWHHGPYRRPRWSPTLKHSIMSG